MPRRFVISVPVGPGAHQRLGETLESIAIQTRPVSIAFCHAGDRDEVEDIIAPYRHLFAHERHAPDDGQSAAINEGWTSVEGDVLGWLNADDALAPDALDVADRMFDEDPKASVACGQSNILNDEGHIVSVHPVVKAPDEDLYRSNIISQPSCFVKREAVERAGYIREDLHYAMDWDLWVRLMEAGEGFSFTPRILSSVVWGSDTKTASFGWSRVKELREIVSRQGRPFTTAKTLLGFGMHHVSEYSAVSGLLKPLNARLRHGKDGQASYWGPGEADGTVGIDLFHYQAGEPLNACLHFAETAQRRVRIEGGDTIESDGTDIDLPVALETGQRCRIRIEAASGASASPVSVALAPEGAGQDDAELASQDSTA